jgi:hypothetical protein
VAALPAPLRGHPIITIKQKPGTGSGRAQIANFNFTNTMIRTVGQSRGRCVDDVAAATPRGAETASADLFTAISRSGLARTPAHRSVRLRRIGRQVDVPAIGKFEVPRKNTPGATFDDKSRAVGELAGKTIGLAHETLIRERELSSNPELGRRFRLAEIAARISVSCCG